MPRKAVPLPTFPKRVEVHRTPRNPVDLAVQMEFNAKKEIIMKQLHGPKVRLANYQLPKDKQVAYKLN